MLDAARKLGYENEKVYGCVGIIYVKQTLLKSVYANDKHKKASWEKMESRNISFIMKRNRFKYL